MPKPARKSTETVLTKLKEAGYQGRCRSCSTSTYQYNGRPFIRNTLAADKNDEYATQALMDIYRVMRPGEPPTRGNGGAICSVGCSLMRSAMTCQRWAA